MQLTRSALISALFPVLLLNWTCRVVGQSLSGLRIGDDEPKLAQLPSKPTNSDPYKEFTVRKWRLENGNYLSVTTSKKGRIVFIESDWNGRSDDTGLDLNGLRFGVTTLSDLRKRFGSNGFGFEQRGPAIEVERGVVMLNSFEVGTTVVTFITKVDAAEYDLAKMAHQDAKIADYARLDAISIADSAYAENEWGKRIYDPAYKPVTWK